MKLTPDAERAVAVITSLGGRPLLVGGFVRDQLLGIESKDIDIEVHGPVSPVELEAALRKVGRVDAVGMAFGVLKFGRDVDVSFPRRDSRTGDGHTGFTIVVDHDMTVEEALSRRDFTINSIAFDPVEGKIIDPFWGRSDLEQRVLRHTSDAFADDPLRVLRAVQFASRFEMSIAPETAALCKSLVPRFSELSIERVWMEWWKILTKGQSMCAVFDALWATGWVDHFHEWHGFTAQYTDRMIKQMPVVDEYRRASMILAMMFYEDVEGLRAFLKRIDAPRWLNDSLLLANTQPERGRKRDESVRRTARRLRGVRLRDWLFVKGASESSPWWKSAEAQGILDQPLKRLLTGDHLIAHGLTPGPLFKKVLDQALDVQDREGWTTEAEAILWLRAHY